MGWGLASRLASHISGGCLAISWVTGRKGYGLSSSRGAAWACPHGTWAVSGERTVVVLLGASLISFTTSF